MPKPEKRKITTFQSLISSASEEIVEVPLIELHSFKNHPYKVLDDESMDELVESVLDNGITNPGIVRERKEGGYELISGHRRKRACEKAGLSTMPVVIRDCSDDEAIIQMVNSNLQRTVILPSEKARAYTMKYEAMKHQGKSGAGDSLEKMAGEEKDSRKTIQRYLWLANLSDELLDMVDYKKLGIVQGVDISFLQSDQQIWVYEYLKENEISMTTGQSSKIKEYGKSLELTPAMVRLILSEEKPKERKVTLKGERITRYFSDDYTNEDIEKVICELLDDWLSKQ